MFKREFECKVQDRSFFMMICICCLIGFIFCDKDNPAESEEIPQPGEYEISVDINGVTRWYTLFIPSGYDHVENRPMLLCFHGGNLSMAFVVNNRQDLIQRCDEENWILAIPNGSNITTNRGSATWNAVHCCWPSTLINADEMGFVQKMVEDLTRDFKIDLSRMYVMGGSNGGMLAHRIAAEMPDLFAATAIWAGTIGGQVDSLSPVLTIQPTGPMPIMMLHGLADRNVNYFGGQTSDAKRFDISFQESSTFWAEYNQCLVNQADTTIINGLQGLIWDVRYQHPQSDIEVRAVTIQNQGHGWPDLEAAGFDGTNFMFDFLQRFTN